MHRIVAVLVGVTAIVVVGIVVAQEPPPESAPSAQTANVEVRVWQNTRDAERLFISARPEGGDWSVLGTIPLDMSGLNSRGTYRYGDITVGVEVEGVAAPDPASSPTPSGSDGPAPPPDPVADPDPVTVNVEVRVWQGVADSRALYISARPEGGDWSVLGTIPLDMSGLNSRETYRYGDVTVQVPVPGTVATPEPTQAPEEESQPWVDPRPANTYSLQDLRGMAAPADPIPPLLPDHILAVSSSYSRTSFRIHLRESTDVVLNLIHNYKSRQYPVRCESSYTDSVACKYTEQGPLNSAGTRRLSLFSASSSVDEYDFVSLTLHGSELQCTERPRGTHRSWWCYDPPTYAAWERARDAALEPATDPLERYLRREGNAPLWYQESPYQGEGRHTTGVMRIEPYVTYTTTLVWTGEFLNLYGLCVPVDTVTGQPDIHSDRIVEGIVGDQFSLRGTYLCEWSVVSDGEWRVLIN